MAPGEAGLRSFIERYARELTAAGAIRSPRVERAFRTVQRHQLLETFYARTAGAQGLSAVGHDPASPRREHLALIYSDDALVTRFTSGMPASSTSVPSLVARMLELLSLGEGMKVLEIGAGTGYNAALMAEEWAASGRPTISDYQVSFLPIEVPCDLPGGGWQVERRFYRELLTLG